MKTKVLFVGAFPPPGHPVQGGNITDCSVLLSSPFADELDLILLDTTQKSLPPPGLAVRTRDSVLRLLRFVRLLRTAKPEAVLVFASSGPSFVEKGAMCWIARRHRCGVVLSVRSGHFMDGCRRSSGMRWLANALLGAPHFVLCQGREWQQFYHDMFRIAGDRCPVVENWVATADLLGVQERRRAGDPHATTFLYLGWMEPFKGVFDLLHAFSELKAEAGDMKLGLHMLGHGSAYASMAQYVREHDLKESVSLPGWVVGEAKLQAFLGADVFVLPSYTEGLPNALVEAMAAGLPVVTTPVGSIPDVVTDGVNGLLFQPGDREGLKRCLRRLASDLDLRQRLGAAGGCLAKDRFTPEVASRKLAATLTAAVALSREECR